MAQTYQFKAQIKAAEGFKNGAYINIPLDVEKTFGKKRVKVKATFDGIPYRGTIVRMGSPEHMLIIKKDIRAQLDKEPGDWLEVQIEEDLEPRIVEMPQDFQAAMEASPAVLTFFKGLSYTHQKEYVRWITEAKRSETRLRRIQKAIERMEAGKKSYS